MVKALPVVLLSIPESRARVSLQRTYFTDFREGIITFLLSVIFFQFLFSSNPFGGGLCTQLILSGGSLRGRRLPPFLSFLRVSFSIGCRHRQKFGIIE